MEAYKPEIGFALLARADNMIKSTQPKLGPFVVRCSTLF